MVPPFLGPTAASALPGHEKFLAAIRKEFKFEVLGWTELRGMFSVNGTSEFFEWATERFIAEMRAELGPVRAADEV
jgi:arginine/ornithine N-succinyltransferase beta subunit